VAEFGGVNDAKNVEGYGKICSVHMHMQGHYVEPGEKGEFKDEAYLFYIRTQCVPRCKHSPPRL
jgi:hypothetical protein